MPTMNTSNLVAEVNRLIPWTTEETPLPLQIGCDGSGGGFVWLCFNGIARVTKDGRVFETWLDLDMVNPEFVTVEVFADGSTQRVNNDA